MIIYKLKIFNVKKFSNFTLRSEIYNQYPNKFVKMEDNRICVLNSLFTQPETYLLACVIDYFSNYSQFEP